jgi:hypothetical protein
VRATFARGARRCARGAVRLDVSGVRPIRVDFKRGRQLLKRDRGAPFETTIPRRRLRVGAVNRLRAVVYLNDGTRVVRSRPVRPCR